MKTSICVISSSAPYKGERAKEALDFAFISAACGIQTSFLLLGDGVYQLLSQQKSQQVDRKNHYDMLHALPVYGIDCIYVDAVSLEQRQITQSWNTLNIVILKKDKLSEFLTNYNQVLNF